MGAQLARQHHAFDAGRFMLVDDVETGYREWLAREARNKKAVVLVAQLDGAVVGYAYGRLEGRDWNLLADAHGGFHDVWVEDAARGHGAGKALAVAMIAALEALGAPFVMLSTAAKNERAQQLFASLGFRATMVEMTRGPARGD